MSDVETQRGQDGEEDFAQVLAEAWHYAYELQYGYCDHGTHTNGQPYKTCEIQAGLMFGRLLSDPDRLLAGLWRDIRELHGAEWKAQP